MVSTRMWNIHDKRPVFRHWCETSVHSFFFAFSLPVVGLGFDLIRTNQSMNHVLANPAIVCQESSSFFCWNEAIYGSVWSLWSQAKRLVPGTWQRSSESRRAGIPGNSTKFFNQVNAEKIASAEWRRSTTTPIWKGKRSPADCENYRTIRLLSHTTKIFDYFNFYCKERRKISQRS